VVASCSALPARLLGLVLSVAVLACGLSELGRNRASASPRAEAAFGPDLDNDPDDANPTEVTVVEHVDIERYMGRWYEIARYPNRFQKDLVGVIAEYTLRDDGTVGVHNMGRKKTLDGKKTEAKAKGWIEDEKTNAKWKVQFFWPFKADYWIIDLCDEYTFAVVGQPSRKYLWILSRTSTMDDPTYDAICTRLKQVQGYDPSKLVKTPRPTPADEKSLRE
jgi:apolipoprotein D and lipocalin family protein